DGQEARGGRGAPVGDPADDRRPHRPSDGREHDPEDERGEDKIHPGASEDDQEPHRERLERERLRRVEGHGPAAALERVLLAHHLDVAAHRDCGETVLGLLPAPAHEHRAEPDREALDPDPGEARDDEVAELVDQDEDADDDDERDHGHHAEAPPRQTSILRPTRRRVSASIATHSSSERTAPAPASSSAHSISWAISVNPMRRARKAATATSFAALSTTGAAPPRASP